MDDKLLVRLYNVGLGDCIYLRVPDGEEEHRHILIDCGNKYASAEELEAAIEHLVDNELPAEPGPDTRKRLDLLVVTHPHEDHLKGFDPDVFEDIHIHRIWLSPSMNPDHPQAQGLRGLQAFAGRALQELRGLALSGPQRARVEALFELTKTEAVEALLEDLPEANDIDPLFVHADTPEADLQVFDDPDVHLRVLGPMRDIDLYYLGKTENQLNSLRALGAELSGLPAEEVTGVPTKKIEYPKNISRGDFDRLRRGLLSNAMSFVLTVGHLVNNTSVVLLLEWEDHRLLFTGDAEVKTSRKGKFEEGKSNGSWNVMWAKKKDLLEDPLDFLKVGHHGSHNATPWTSETVKIDGQEQEHPVNEILDSLLPLGIADPDDRAGHAIVSTSRTNAYSTIPDPELMETLGERVRNVEKYAEEPVKGISVAATIDQPWRTDLKGQPRLELEFPRDD